MEPLSNQYDSFEPTARILAANALSQSLSFCMERKYLNGITQGGVFNLAVEDMTESHVSPYWIQIEQVGKPLSENMTDCFSAIQKILNSCFMPGQAELLFLIHSQKGVCKLFLGIRPYNSKTFSVDFSDNLGNFIRGIWPGLSCHEVARNEMQFLQDRMNQGSRKYRCFYSLTGIPSMESQYKSTYPATIDKLIAGMDGKDFTYLVVASPIAESEVDAMLYQCRDMNGQAESLKSFNYSESNGQGHNQSYSHAKSISDSTSHTEGTSESVTQEHKNKGFMLAGAGLMLASAVFPPAGVLGGIVNTGAALLETNKAISELAGINLLTGFAPTKSKTKSTSKSDTTSHSESITDTETTGFSTNQSKSISQNLVNKHIEAISESLFYHSKRLETGKAIGCWNVGVYLMGELEQDLQAASLQLRSILSGQESIYEPIRIHDVTDIVRPIREKTLAKFEAPLLHLNVENKVFRHPLGRRYDELKTVLTTKELSYLINFPLRSVPGISVIDSTPEFSLNQPSEQADGAIAFGKLLYGGSLTNMSYSIPTNVLSRHTLLSGINGSGKTNTVQAILNHLKDIPFLIIEPAKTEYVDWAIAYNKEHPERPIDIYIPGCKKYKKEFSPKPLKINPFELVWLDKEQEPNVLTHIDRLKSTFAAAFPMYDILPVLMEDLIYTIYQNKTTNWLGEEPQFGITLPPTLNSMSVSVDKVISNRQYEERIERNMKACLNTRIDSLKRGWKGEMLNTVRSTPWEELFERPCVINLSYVGDDVDKSFFMSLILQFLYEYRSACAEAGRTDFNDNCCKHLTVIEEAHRVMAKCEKQDLPQYKSAMMFSNMLSEIRAYGEGMFLVDQVPTRLIPDAIKNTNLKITHRLVAEDDCKAIGESMGLNEEQRKVIPKLLTGQCIVSSSLSTDTYWIKADKVK